MNQRESRKRTNVRSVTLEEYKQVRGIMFGRASKKVQPSPLDSTLGRVPAWGSENLSLIWKYVEDKKPDENVQETAEEVQEPEEVYIQREPEVAVQYEEVSEPEERVVEQWEEPRGVEMEKVLAEMERMQMELEMERKRADGLELMNKDMERMRIEFEMERKRADELELMNKEMDRMRMELRLERKRADELELRNKEMERMQRELEMERKRADDLELRNKGLEESQMHKEGEREREDEDLREQIKKGSIGYAKLEESLKAKQKEFEDVVALNAQMADKFDQFEDDMENANLLLAQEREKNEKLQKENQKLHDEIDKIRKTLSDYLDQLDLKAKELEAVREESNLTQRGLAEKESELMMVKRDLEELAECLAMAQAESGKLQKLQDQLKDLTTQKSQLEEDLVSERQGYEDFQKQGEQRQRNLEGELSRLRKQVEEEEDAHGDTRSRLEEAEARVRGLETELNLHSGRAELMGQMERQQKEILQEKNRLLADLEKEREIKDKLMEQTSQNNLELSKLTSAKMEHAQSLLLQKFFLGLEVRRLTHEVAKMRSREKSLEIQLEDAKQESHNFSKKILELTDQRKEKDKKEEKPLNPEENPAVLQKINELNECMLKLEDRIVSKLRNISPMVNKNEQKKNIRECSPFAFSKASKKAVGLRKSMCYYEEFPDNQDSQNYEWVGNCPKVLFAMGGHSCVNCQSSNKVFYNCTHGNNGTSLKVVPDKNYDNEQSYKFGDRSEPLSRSKSCSKANSKRNIKIFKESAAKLLGDSTLQMCPDDYENSNLFINSASRKSGNSQVQKPQEFLEIQLNPSGFSESNVVQSFRPSKDTLRYSQQRTHPSNLFRPYTEMNRADPVYATACWPKSPERSENTEKFNMTSPEYPLSGRPNDSFNHMESFRQKLHQVQQDPPTTKNLSGAYNKYQSLHFQNHFPNSSQQFDNNSMAFQPRNTNEMNLYKKTRGPSNYQRKSQNQRPSSPLMVKVTRRGHSARSKGGLNLKTVPHGQAIQLNLENPDQSSSKTFRSKSKLKNALIKESKMKFRSKAQSLHKIKNNLKMPPKLAHFKRHSEKGGSTKHFPKFVKSQRALTKDSSKDMVYRLKGPMTQIQKLPFNLVSRPQYSQSRISKKMQTQPNALNNLSWNKQSLSSYGSTWRKSTEKFAHEAMQSHHPRGPMANDSLKIKVDRRQLNPMAEPISFQANTPNSNAGDLEEFHRKMHSKFIKNVKNVNSQRSLGEDKGSEGEDVFAKVVRISVNGTDVPLEKVKNDQKLHSELKRNGYSSFEDNGKKGYRKRSASHSKRNSRRSSMNSRKSENMPRAYEIPNSEENLPPRKQVPPSKTQRKKGSINPHRYSSPRRIHSKSNNPVESTAKKNHSSSSQVNNFSREENLDKREEMVELFGRNIHMRETFKCGEESDARLGFSFHPRETEKESLALWKNVSMPVSTPGSNMMNAVGSSKLHRSPAKPGKRNPFDNSHDSQGPFINSSKTKHIKLQPSPNQSMNFLSEDGNISSLSNHPSNPPFKNLTNQRPNKWARSEDVKIKSFPSGSHALNFQTKTQTVRDYSKENRKLTHS